MQRSEPGPGDGQNGQRLPDWRALIEWRLAQLEAAKAWNEGWREKTESRIQRAEGEIANNQATIKEIRTALSRIGWSIFGLIVAVSTELIVYVVTGGKHP